MRLSQAEVKPKPGSCVNTPWSFDNAAISMTSGPIVPDLTGNRLFFPVAGLVSSKFLSAMQAILGGVVEAYTLPRSEERRVGQACSQRRQACDRTESPLMHYAA